MRKRFEVLEARNLLAALLAVPLLATESHGPVSSYVVGNHNYVSSILGQGTQPRIQSALVQNSRLNPVGVDEILALPPGELAEVLFLLDSDSAVGNVYDKDSNKTLVLWTSPNDPLAISTTNNGVVAALETEQGFFIVLNEDSFIQEIVHVDRLGLKSTIAVPPNVNILGANIVGDKPKFFGSSFGKPVVIELDQSFEVVMTEFEAPDNTFISEFVGANENVFVGNLVTFNGENLVGYWSKDGVFQKTITTESSALGVSGSILRISKGVTEAIVPLDSASASYFGVRPFEVVDPSTLAPLAGKYEDVLPLGIVQEGEVFYATYAGILESGGFEPIFVGAHTNTFNGFHNKENPNDVNNDGRISPIDALLIINTLNLHGSRFLGLEDVDIFSYIDVNNDGFVSPLDVLIVINYLNLRSAGGEGEGESDVQIVMAPEFDFEDALKRRRAQMHDTFFIAL